MTALAFEFLILNASRTNEILPARREEIDLARAVWTVPPERIKTGVEHIVPLSERAVAIVKRALELGGKDEELVFPSRKRGKPLSNMVFLMMLRRMKLEVTAHGFRSSFRDWAAEETEFPDFVVEKALAHAIDNKVEAAYRRGDLLKKRRELMGEWASYCTGKQTSATANDRPQEGLRRKAHLDSDPADAAIRAGDQEVRT
jgi:integrase